MFLAIVWRNEDALAHNPEFDPETMDPNGEVDPQVIKRVPKAHKIYIEPDERTVKRNQGVITEIDYWRIEPPASPGGKPTLVAVDG